MASNPTLYEHFAGHNITSGLTYLGPNFYLNNKPITIYSGTLQYFRVPPTEWRQALRKLRSVGLNTVETYIPWNLHEPMQETYDFGDGDSDMSAFLDFKTFFKIAQEEDLFVLARPGPYINSEFEFGGMPSWLQRYDGIDLRSSNALFMNAVTRYFNVLLPILALFQFFNGGPIIGFQVENEYGGYLRNIIPDDQKYLEQLRDLYIVNGITRSLLFTCDPPLVTFGRGQLPGLLSTATLSKYPEIAFGLMALYSGQEATMAVEFWSGWFDNVGGAHHVQSLESYEDNLKRIINYPASVNQYIFHGGTSFGFLSGGIVSVLDINNGGYEPRVSSYDFDAPISENGDYTKKYYVTKALLKNTFMAKFKTPKAPNLEVRHVYSELKNPLQLSATELISQAPYAFEVHDLTPMEMLPMNNNSGQSYGYIVYRKTNLYIPADSTLTIEGRVCDTVMVLINGVVVSPPLLTWNDVQTNFGSWNIKDSSLHLGYKEYVNATLDLITENWGRSSFGFKPQQFQFKGLYQGPVCLNDETLENFVVIPLEFKKSYNRMLNGWHQITSGNPAMYKFALDIADTPKSTYLDMRGWTKGFVVVNNFVLGRYAIYGPTLALYLPKYFLKTGLNEILVFEHYNSASFTLNFAKDPLYTETIVDQNSQW